MSDTKKRMMPWAIRRAFATLAVLAFSFPCPHAPVSAFSSVLPRRHTGVSSSITVQEKRSFHRTPTRRSFTARPQTRKHFHTTRLFQATTSTSDKEEWRALLAAFQLYKAAYGDLKVPVRFVVPSMKPWPGKYRPKRLAPVSPVQWPHSICPCLFRGDVGHETWTKSGPNPVDREVYRQQRTSTKAAGKAWIHLETSVGTTGRCEQF